MAPAAASVTSTHGPETPVFEANASSAACEPPAHGEGAGRVREPCSPEYEGLATGVEATGRRQPPSAARSVPGNLEGAGAPGSQGDGARRNDGSDSLNLSVGWEGLVLEDVELRRDFMAELLGLPVDVPTAFIRRAVLHLPWYTLMLG